MENAFFSGSFSMFGNDEHTIIVEGQTYITVDEDDWTGKLTRTYLELESIDRVFLKRELASKRKEDIPPCAVDIVEIVSKCDFTYMGETYSKGETYWAWDHLREIVVTGERLRELEKEVSVWLSEQDISDYFNVYDRDEYLYEQYERSRELERMGIE